MGEPGDYFLVLGFLRWQNWNRLFVYDVFFRRAVILYKSQQKNPFKCKKKWALLNLIAF